MEKAIKTIGLCKAFSKLEVIKNVDMNVKKGEIYGFLGPNGAGKTTIIRMLTNLVKPTGGEIELFGEPLISKPQEILKRIGAIIEYPVFYDKLTAKENLEVHCEYMGYPNKGEIQKALDLLQLKGVDNRRVKDFSLGMKQRLGIARAIVTKPELLLLDEPINGLDPEGIKMVREIFKMLSKEYGMTLLISSHVLSEIEQVADTVGVISEGRLIKEVSMEEVRQTATEYIELITSDTLKASLVLEEQLKISNFKIVEENKVRIYVSTLLQDKIFKELVLHEVPVEGIIKKNISLEDYFLRLVKGEGIHV